MHGADSDGRVRIDHGAGSHAQHEREAAEVRNGAEQLVYTVEKLLKDNEDKLPDEVKTEVGADVEALKTALAGSDEDAVKTAFEKLSQSQSKIGEAIYQAGGYADAAAPDADRNADAGSAEQGGDEDIVDAEVVDEDEK